MERPTGWEPIVLDKAISMERTTGREPILLGKARTFEEREAILLDAYDEWCRRQGYYDSIILPPIMSFEEWRVEYVETWRKPSEYDWFEEWLKTGDDLGEIC